ncbi:FAD-dependent oxidoreductase [Salinibacterium hongtaonis]|uniref:FAD-binding protein n=1 Tax=Homoserinimonas hongtaonis TaxID=2079791 RepID=A0A2U1T157_9MICO|nr:FAD-dependent oxidoreductase [Salinibacterium hongtaonis]AWB90160.1 FAD-binding dehydrogenase [Salinibacterium hongtaonis]PWB97600.1 FAD-binding protein [Salinibacterium hongtaonis]
MLTPPAHRLSDLSVAEVDVIVVGTGAGGLASALFAAAEGARVLLVERTELIGGTTAYTAGTLWIPGTHLAMEGGAPSGDLESAERYLDLAVGDRSDRSLRSAFLHTGPEAIRALARERGMKLRVRPQHPDYMAELPDSAAGWRPIEACTVNGAHVPGLNRVRQQTPEFTVFGGLQLESQDIAAFSRVARAPLNPANWGHVLRAAFIFAKHAVSRPFHARATRMTMGNALIGRLLIALNNRGVPILLGTSVDRIVMEDGRVSGVELVQGSERRTVRARALISATGGFNRSPRRRQSLLPDSPMQHSPIAPGSTGQLHDLIEELGGHYGEVADSPAFWAPVSLVPRPDGSEGVYPHFALDRAKPGFVVVDQDGKRYLNESLSYHRFGLAMQQHQNGRGVPSFLITDAASLKRFGIGAVRPGGWGRRKRLRDGYLVQASSIEDLAPMLGIAPETLRSTIDTFNGYADAGIDPDLGRGTTRYERALGDPEYAGANPTLGPLRKGPFFAIRLYPGDIGAAQGFVTDVNSRILRSDGSAVVGLYAVGNDMQSVMGDRYPGPGITLGPAVVFGYIAARHARKEWSSAQQR